MEMVATCSTTDVNGSYYGLAPSFFEEMTCCRRQKHCRRRPDNPNRPSKFSKYRVYLHIHVCLRLCNRVCCSAANGSGSCHAPAPSYFEEIQRCRRQKLHWRWPGNPNGRSKFRNLGLFMFTRSQLTLWRRLCGWWRLPEIAQTARYRRQKHRRRWPGLIEIPQQNENLCLRDQAKRLEKILFAATNDAAMDGIAHRLLSCYHSQRLLCTHSNNNFSMTLTPTEKPRYTYCRVFFCKFYL